MIRLGSKSRVGITMLSSTIDFQHSYFPSAKAGHLCDEQPRSLRRQGMYAEVLIWRWAKTDICSFTADAESEGMLFLRMKAEGKLK